MASWMPCRAVRNAVGTRIFGSAESDEVSELVCRQRTFSSRITSCTANAPADDSALMMISQSSELTNCRVLLAASSGLPLESRVMISILRPPRPPAALNFSASIVSALRDEIPSCATRPDRIVGTPILIGLSCALETNGKPRLLAAPSAPAAWMNLRRLPKVTLAVDIHSSSSCCRGSPRFGAPPASPRSRPCMGPCMPGLNVHAHFAVCEVCTVTPHPATHYPENRARMQPARGQHAASALRL